MKQNTKASRWMRISVPASILAVSLNLSGCWFQNGDIPPISKSPADTEAAGKQDEPGNDAFSTSPSDGALSSESGNGTQNGVSNPQTDREFDRMTKELYAELVSIDYLTQRRFYQNLDADSLSWASDRDGIELTACEPALPDLSETSWNQHLELVKSLKFQLGTIDRSQLSGSRQELYDILNVYADAELKKEGLASFRLLHALSPEEGMMLQLPKKLNSLSFHSRQDIEHYLTLLADLPRLFKDLADLGREGAEEGLHFTEQWLKDASAACAPYALPPEHNSLVFSFPDRLNQIPDLTEEERAGYISRNQEAVSRYVIPAYQKLSQDIRELPVRTLEYEGLCGQNGGREYYRYLVLRNSGTSYQDIRQLKNAIEDQLEQNTQSLNELLQESSLESQALHPTASEADDPEEILAFLQKETDKHFPACPSGETAKAMGISVFVAPLESEDLWEIPSAEPIAFDGFALDSFLTDAPAEPAAAANAGKPAAYHLFLNQNTADNQGHLYAALSEAGFPGQAYREHYTIQSGKTPLLTALSFPGWERGWDLYGRIYAISFDNGLTPEARQMARLSLSSSKAIHALIDIQVNYYGWGLKEVQEYLAGQYHTQEEGVAEALYRKSLYAPADSVIEYAGYLEIRQIKAQAQAQLGDAFDETAFHRFLLDGGASPFGLIRTRLKGWLLEQNLSKIGN